MRDTRARCLRIKHLRRDTTKDGQQGHREDNHTDASLPLRQTPPKKDAMRQPLNIGQDRRTSGREARHSLKKGIRDIHHENAYFKKIDGNWMYEVGDVKPMTVVREGAKVGRNDPCPCGSGKKFKKCCGR